MAWATVRSLMLPLALLVLLALLLLRKPVLLSMGLLGPPAASLPLPGEPAATVAAPVEGVPDIPPPEQVIPGPGPYPRLGTTEPNRGSESSPVASGGDGIRLLVEEGTPPANHFA